MCNVSSWDLFDTLVAGRNPKVAAGNQEGHFPIAENIAMVRPEDIVVSDYYDPAKAERLLREVAGLPNRLFVTEGGKRDGSIWKTLPPVRQHTGDNLLSDVQSAEGAGIRAIRATQAGMTPMEAWLGEHVGLEGLARCCREGRLTMYSPEYRGHELLQSQLNFPFLFAASVLLHRDAGNATDLLMSSRDCCLWSSLMERFGRLAGGGYRVHYYLTSRIAKQRASPGHIAYTEAIMGDRPVMADLGGFGRSLAYLAEKTRHPDAPIRIVARYPESGALQPLAGNVRFFVGVEETSSSRHPGYMEGINSASHPRVLDTDRAGNPIYEPTAELWGSPHILNSHRAFNAMLDIMPKHDFSPDLKRTEGALKEAMIRLLASLDDHWGLVEKLQGIHRRESALNDENVGL